MEVISRAPPDDPLSPERIAAYRKTLREAIPSPVRFSGPTPPTQFNQLDLVRCYTCNRVVSGSLATSFRGLRERYINELRSVQDRPELVIPLLRPNDIAVYESYLATQPPPMTAREEAETFQFLVSRWVNQVTPRQLYLFSRVVSNLPERNIVGTANTRALNEVAAIRVCDREHLLNPLILPAGVAYSSPNNPRVIEWFRELLLPIATANRIPLEEVQLRAEEAARIYISLMASGSPNSPKTLREQEAAPGELEIALQVEPDLSREEKLTLFGMPLLSGTSAETAEYLLPYIKAEFPELNLTSQRVRELLSESGIVRLDPISEVRGRPRVGRVNKVQERLLELLGVRYRAQQEMRRLIERNRELVFRRLILQDVLRQRSFTNVEIPLTSPEVVSVVLNIGSAAQTYMQVTRDRRLNYVSKANGVTMSVANNTVETRLPPPPSELVVTTIGEYTEEDITQREGSSQEFLASGENLAEPEPDLDNVVANLPIAPGPSISLAYQQGILNFTQAAFGGGVVGPPTNTPFPPTTATLPVITAPATTTAIPFPTTTTTNPFQILPGLAPPPQQGHPTPSLNPIGRSPGPSIGVFPGNIYGAGTALPGALLPMPNTGDPSLTGREGSGSSYGGHG